MSENTNLNLQISFKQKLVDLHNKKTELVNQRNMALSQSIVFALKTYLYSQKIEMRLFIGMYKVNVLNLAYKLADQYMQSTFLEYNRNELANIFILLLNRKITNDFEKVKDSIFYNEFIKGDYSKVLTENQVTNNNNMYNELFVKFFGYSHNFHKKIFLEYIDQCMLGDSETVGIIKSYKMLVQDDKKYNGDILCLKGILVSQSLVPHYSEQLKQWIENNKQLVHAELSKTNWEQIMQELIKIGSDVKIINQILAAPINIKTEKTENSQITTHDLEVMDIEPLIKRIKRESQ